VTVGAAQSTLTGSYNGFVCKLSADGSTLVYGTLIGGTRSDTATSIAVDASGRAILGGYTTSPDFPMVAAVQAAFQGPFDAFAAVLDTGGANIVFSSYFGGSGDDRAYAVAALKGNDLFLGGMTSSGNFPTLSALQNALSVAPDAFALVVNYALSSPPVAGPVFNPPGGVYTAVQTVTLSTTTAGASIRYTTDGSMPSESSGVLYSGPIAVSSNTTIKAMAYASGMTDSAVGSASYTVSAQVAGPVFNPAGGAYTAAQTVTLSTTTAGASMRYSSDGSTPSESSGVLYSGPIAVSSNTTIKAMAYASGMTDSAVSSAAYSISGGGGGPAWYNSAWSSRKAVTIDHTKVVGGANLNNFPLLFTVTDASLKSAANGGSMGKPDGTDMLFTASDGVTKLNHEIESYTASSGQVLAWVQIPTLSAASDMVIYVYYGNAGAANQQNTAGTWDSSFKTVWHLASGATLSAADSTSTANAGQIVGALSAAGPLGGGVNFNATGYLSATAAGVLASHAWTVTLWIKLNAAANTVNLFNFADATGETVGLCYWYQGGLLCQRGAPMAADTTQLVSPPAVGTWHLYSFAYDGVSAAMKIYVDGVNQSAAGSGLFWSPYGTNQFALSYGLGGGWPAPMTVDEVRIANLMRSPGWIATEYNNQNSPASFFSTQ